MKEKIFIKKLYYNGVQIRVGVRDAKEEVVMDRTAEDGVTGIPADPEACMNANCAMRHAGDGTFPHPVIAVWFIKTMAFIMTSDKPTNGLYQVVRYRHWNWDDEQKFDKAASKAERAAIAADKKIYLAPLKGANRIGGHRPHTQGRRNRHWMPTGRVGIPRGVNARFITLKQYKDTQEKKKET